MYAKHAELKAGIVMLAAIGALLALLYVASGESFWGSWHTFEVRFEPGTLAPKKDDPVHINGVRVGRVKEVDLKLAVRRDAELTAKDRQVLGLLPGEPGTAREVYVHATLEIQADQVLPEGTYAEVSESITGAVTLTLYPGRSTENLTEEAARAKPIPGFQAVGLPDLSARIGELVKQIEKLVEGGGGVLDEAKLLLQTLRQKVEKLDTEGISEEARGAVASLRRTLDGLEPKIARIGANVEDATGDLKRMAATGATAIGDVDKDLDELLATLKQVAGRLDQILAKAAPKVDTFLDSMVRVGRDLERLAAELQGLGPDARAVLRELGVDADEVMGTLKDVARNVLDASEDIRSRPWILLNEPEPGEIAFDNVRIATQNYARAMAQMNATAERLVKLSTGAAGADPETRRLLLDTLAQFRTSQERYQRVERGLLQALQQTGPAVPARPPPPPLPPAPR